jgi:hypothetical protein
MIQNLSLRLLSPSDTLRERRSSTLREASYAMTIGHFFTWNTLTPYYHQYYKQRSEENKDERGN